MDRQQNVTQLSITLHSLSAISPSRHKNELYHIRQSLAQSSGSGYRTPNFLESGTDRSYSKTHSKTKKGYWKGHWIDS